MISGPSEADPHRFSDAAALATPPMPAPMPSGYESNAAPGAAGPAASDALYFVGHSGGHPALSQARPPSARSHRAPSRKVSSRNFSATGEPAANPSIPIASSATSRSCNSRCMESR